MLEHPLARGNLGCRCKLRGQIAENPSSVQLRPPILQKYGFPPTHPYISESAFSHGFQKVYTYPPPHPRRDGILAHWTKNSQNPGKVPKPTINNVSERNVRPFAAHLLPHVAASAPQASTTCTEVLYHKSLLWSVMHRMTSHNICLSMS